MARALAFLLVLSSTVSVYRDDAIQIEKRRYQHSLKDLEEKLIAFFGKARDEYVT